MLDMPMFCWMPGSFLIACWEEWNASHRDAGHAMQRKLVRELEPVLALPLTSAACLTFLRRHLALPPAQLALLEGALQANAQRLASLQQALREAEQVRVDLCACKLREGGLSCCALGSLALTA